MIIYEAYNTTTNIQFATEQEALEYANENNMEVRSIEQIETPPIVDYTSIYFKAKKFGETLKDTFLVDNWNLPIRFTPEMSFALMQKFQGIMAFASVGEIRRISELLPHIEVDTIFTQERKDRYTQMVNEFVNENYPILSREQK